MRNPQLNGDGTLQHLLTIEEGAQGRPLSRLRGLSYRVNGHVEHTPERPPLENMGSSKSRPAS